MAADMPVAPPFYQGASQLVSNFQLFPFQAWVSLLPFGFTQLNFQTTLPAYNYRMQLIVLSLIPGHWFSLHKPSNGNWRIWPGSTVMFLVACLVCFSVICIPLWLCVHCVYSFMIVALFWCADCLLASLTQACFWHRFHQWRAIALNHPVYGDHAFSFMAQLMANGLSKGKGPHDFHVQEEVKGVHVYFGLCIFGRWVYVLSSGLIQNKMQSKKLFPKTFKWWPSYAGKHRRTWL